LWVEAKTNDGKSYFYHAVTRETTWNRPEAPNIKIMSQPEFEAYTKQQLTNKPDLSQQPPQQQQQQQIPPQG
jgi:transcription elongation regulator 1